MSTEKSGWSRLSHNAYRENLVGKRCSGYTEHTTERGALQNGLPEPVAIPNDREEHSMAKFNSARWLRRYGKCQSLNEIIKAARIDSTRKPNVKRRTASADSTKTPQYQVANT